MIAELEDLTREIKRGSFTPDLVKALVAYADRDHKSLARYNDATISYREMLGSTVSIRRDGHITHMLVCDLSCVWSFSIEFIDTIILTFDCSGSSIERRRWVERLRETIA